LDGWWLLVGLSCRWLDRAVRKQCAGHLPFERQATVNGGFSILPIGTTDPQETFTVFRAMPTIDGIAVVPLGKCTSAPLRL